MAKEHHYDNAMQQALDASAIPVSVYENLIGTINRRLPAMYRYVELRKSCSESRRFICMTIMCRWWTAGSEVFF